MEEEPHIKIPPGLTPLHQWKEVHSGAEPAPESIRWYRDHVAYVLDPENEEFRQFLEKCKEDTKALESNLREEFKERKFPIWTRRRKNPVYAKNWRRMSFVIRPPFLQPTNCYVKKDTTNRFQSLEGEDVIMLHMDEDGKLDVVRTWKPKEFDQKSMAEMYLRLEIARRLQLEKDYFNEHAGDWTMIAKKIADILEEMKIKDKIEAINKMHRESKSAVEPVRQSAYPNLDTVDTTGLTEMFKSEILSRQDFVDALQKHYSASTYTPEAVARTLTHHFKNRDTLQIKLSDMTLVQFLSLCCHIFTSSVDAFDEDVYPLLQTLGIDPKEFQAANRINYLVRS